MQCYSRCSFTCLGSIIASSVRPGSSRCYSEGGLPWEKTPYRAARINLSKIPDEKWTPQLRQEFPQLLKGI